MGSQRLAGWHRNDEPLKGTTNGRQGCLPAQDARVRLASVNALLALYSNPDNLASLSDFTQRFQQRFSELFYDVDEAVAVKGVRTAEPLGPTGAGSSPAGAGTCMPDAFALQVQVWCSSGFLPIHVFGCNHLILNCKCLSCGLPACRWSSTRSL